MYGRDSLCTRCGTLLSPRIRTGLQPPSPDVTGGGGVNGDDKSQKTVATRWARRMVLTTYMLQHANQAKCPGHPWLVSRTPEASMQPWLYAYTLQHTVYMLHAHGKLLPNHLPITYRNTSANCHLDVRPPAAGCERLVTPPARSAACRP